MNFKEILNRLMGKGSPTVSRDERGFPLRKVTTDDLELESYAEEDRRDKVKVTLALKRRENLTKAMTYGGYGLKIRKPKPLPKFDPKVFKGSGKKEKKEKNILDAGDLFFK